MVALHCANPVVVNLAVLCVVHLEEVVSCLLVLQQVVADSLLGAAHVVLDNLLCVNVYEILVSAVHLVPSELEVVSLVVFHLQVLRSVHEWLQYRNLDVVDIERVSVDIAATLQSATLSYDVEDSRLVSAAEKDCVSLSLAVDFRKSEASQYIPLWTHAVCLCSLYLRDEVCALVVVSKCVELEENVALILRAVDEAGIHVRL